MNNLGKIIILAATVSILGNVFLGIYAMQQGSAVAAAQKASQKMKADYEDLLAATNGYYMAEINRVREGFTAASSTRNEYDELKRKNEGLKGELRVIQDQVAKANAELKRYKEEELGSLSKRVEVAEKIAEDIKTDNTSLTTRQVYLQKGLYTDYITTDSKSISMRLAVLTASTEGELRTTPVKRVGALFSNKDGSEKSPTNIAEATSNGIFTLRVPKNYPGPVTIQVLP